MKKCSAVVFAVLLLLLAGCQAGSGTGEYAELTEVTSTETGFPEEAEMTRENEVIAEEPEDNAITEDTWIPREPGKDYFEIWFSLRDGDAYPGNFTLTDAEGLVLQVRDGESSGTMGIAANDLYSAQKNSPKLQ